MKKEEINYGDNLIGYMAHDESKEGKLPAVLIAPAWAGRDKIHMKMAESIAELGLVGFTLDMYGDAKTGNSIEENNELITPFMQDRELLKNRILSAFEKVKTLPNVDENKIAAIGFCFGGLCVLDLARSGADLKGVISFHGLLMPPNLPKNKIRAKVLACHGNDDPMVNHEAVIGLTKELTEAEADWQIHIYGNTKHAFTNQDANSPELGIVYNETARKRSFQSMENFLSEIFA
ncbi:MAG: carboxymethylenebutenolidase [Epsilonproteobacteria bacterium]|nr:MAG: carboxymethylenebutenolidase [Campylobacterota bacterium]RLA65302.1 MAG: carboxymethylenebutenolidase [Campylobacterota bacterium]